MACVWVSVGVPGGGHSAPNDFNMTTRSSRNRPWLVVILVLIAAGISAYFVGGWLAGKASERQVAVYQTQLRDTQNQLVAAQSLNHVLRASNAVYLAMEALDNRNFGTANTDIGIAVTNLKSVQGASPAAVAAVQRRAAGVKISVATNLESQRRSLLGLARAINALVP